VPAIALVARLVALGAAAIFAAFVAGNGVPTLRHDWTWPIDRSAIASFVTDSLSGWSSAGLGNPNPHPTTYLVGPTVGAIMWIAGPLTALAIFAAVIALVCVRNAGAVSFAWGGRATAAVGAGLFALFNPWVYNEVVAGHLVMVLAYAAFIGLFAEMLRGRRASWLAMAFWLVLIEAQLQFFIVAMVAVAIFAFTTKTWAPLALGAIVALPSAVGLAAERGALLRIPYTLEWQTNQSVAPLPLLGLGGYFPGYSDRLGIVAAIAVWIVVALAVGGTLVTLRRKAARWGIAAAIATYVAMLGVHGPLAASYAWIVRNVPESGVFRELYDLGGILAALVVLLACAATARASALGYVTLAAGLALAVTWVLDPPATFWVPAAAYPHPVVAAVPFTRTALLPAFQPLGLRGGRGEGADPDAYVHPGPVSTINEYFPTYPVDMALARYAESGDTAALRAFGVSGILARPWLVSRARGGVGLAAASLQPRIVRSAPTASLPLSGATPLISQCEAPQIVATTQPLGACDVFFADAPDAAPLQPVVAPGDSIDPRTAWIEAPLAFAELPELAQAFGGALTVSRLPQRVVARWWLLAYLRGTLRDLGGASLGHAAGSWLWLRVPDGVSAVRCDGLCELAAQTAYLPQIPPPPATQLARPLHFSRVTPWFYVVQTSGGAGSVLRFNERYDRAWIALEGARPLRHLRIDAAVNGWLLAPSTRTVVLLQVTALLQSIAEVAGICCVLWLLKALANAPTKRVS